ncbi:MAG: pyruvate formate lyase activating enzyme [Alteromonadaceae bacterium]|jgi:pyruvate formate lyase activating enzyme
MMPNEIAIPNPVPSPTSLVVKNGLHYVYCANVHDRESDSTYCPGCHKQVIQRDWYELGQYPLDGCFDGQQGSFGRHRIPVKLG